MNDFHTEEMPLVTEVSDEALEAAAEERVGLWTCSCTCSGCPNAPAGDAV